MNRLIKVFVKNWFFFLVLLLGFTPAIWFWGKDGVLINGVDTNFPLNPLIWFNRRFFVWNNILNAGQDFQSSIAGLFFHFIQVIPYKLGFELQTVEIFSFIFWFVLIVLSAYFFAKTIFPKSKLVQLLFVIFYTFNIYLFNSWENVKVANLSLVAAIPLILNLLILYDTKQIPFSKFIFLTSVVGLVVSGSGINPSYFIVFLLIIFLYFLGNLFVSTSVRDILPKLKVFLIVNGLIVLINSFWLIPTIGYIASSITPGSSIENIGFTNWIDSLSENTSLLNVFRLQGAWDWYSFDSITGLPLYIPYALRYFYTFPFIAFSFLIPLIVFSSFLVEYKALKNIRISFILMLILGIFLGVGTHPPTGYLFRWLLLNIPFFSLFRSPWYIFTPLVTLSYAGLIGIFFYGLLEMFKKQNMVLQRFIVFFFITLIIVGNMFYSYPLFLGKIFRPKQSDGFYIKFPEYVFEAGKWLKDKDSGRIINYPDDEIERFNWGYRGIESILQLITDKEVLFLPLNVTDSPVAVLVRQFYSDIKKNKLTSAFSIAHKLGASFIFEKRDQSSLSPSLPGEIQGLTSQKFGEWVFYDISSRTTAEKIYSGKSFLFSYPYLKNSETVSFLEKGDHILNPDDRIINSITNIDKITGKVVKALNIQKDNYLNFSNSPSKLSNRLMVTDLSKAQYQIEIPEDGSYIPVLEKYRLEDFGLSNFKELNLFIDDVSSIWKLEQSNDSYLTFRPFVFTKGKHLIVFDLENKNLVKGGDFEGPQAFEKAGYGEGKDYYEIYLEGGNKFLSIFNLGRAESSAVFDVNNFDQYFPYYIEVKYKQIYGNNASVLVDQHTPKTLVKAQTERLPNYPEWQKFSFYYQPVETNSIMRVLVISPHTKDPLGTKIFYDDMVVKKVFTNSLNFIKRSTTLFEEQKIIFEKKSPVLYEGSVEARGPHFIIFSENYSPGWRMEIRNSLSDEKRIISKHFSLDLYANAWYLDLDSNKYNFKIYYMPQSLFYLGFAISLITIISIVILYLLQKYDVKAKI